ncbi:MAG: cyanobactin biosynthesis PatC/TenC/TruC family protein [Gloeotrichia echinulata IR180]
MSKKEKATAQSNQAQEEKIEEIKSHLLATGLEDYGFWWQEIAKIKSQQTEQDKPFRRGRIWS